MIKDLWYKNAVIYSLSVATFMDSDGDGIGDFKGLLNRLDYLQGLGITAIWLMPFQSSPGRDDGYDVADYYSVDPRYGTLGDFVEFTHGCKQRGMRVLIDLVVNHTSDQHPWFQEARRDPNSKSVTGTCGPRRGPPMQPRALCFLEFRNRHGTAIRLRSSGTFTAFTSFNRIWIPRTRSPIARSTTSRRWGRTWARSASRTARAT